MNAARANERPKVENGWITEIAASTTGECRYKSIALAAEMLAVLAAAAGEAVCLRVCEGRLNDALRHVAHCL